MSLNAHGARLDAESETLLPTTGGAFDVSHALRGEGFDASEEGSGRGTPLVPVGFDCKGSQVQTDEGIVGPLRSMSHHGSHANAGGHAAVAFDMRGRQGGAMPEGPHDTANIRAASGGSSRSYVAEPWAVRRLTPTECHRLMGFPDGWCQIPWRGKPAENCPDGPQYKALGNSWAVNCGEWIFDRIKMIEEMEDHHADA